MHVSLFVGQFVKCLFNFAVLRIPDFVDKLPAFPEGFLIQKVF